MRYWILTIGAVMLALVFADRMMSFYDYLAPQRDTGFFLDFSIYTVAIPLCVVLILPGAIMLLGDSKRYQALKISIAILGGIEFLSEWKYIYIPISFLLISIAAGWTIRFLISNTLGKTSQGEILKKYF